MINTLIATIEHILVPLGAKGIFAAAIIEEVVAPIPSALVQMGGGFFLLGGSPISLSSLLSLFLQVVLPAALGVTFGSLFVYGLAYWLGKPFLMKWGKWLGLSWADIEKAEAKFTKGYADELLLFGLRCVPIIPSVAISAFCGLIRFPLRTYLIFSLLGTLVRASGLGFIGWQAGHLYREMAAYINRVEEVVGLGLGLILLILVGYLVYKSKVISHKP